MTASTAQTAHTSQLAVIIPAYKARFLGATLASLARQSSRDFVVHVFDDASPDSIGPVVEQWQHCLDIRCHRFQDNLGESDLAAHWRRCVAMSSEPWVWLLADDDVIPADAVSRFLCAIARDGGATDLFRFDVEWIDAAGNAVRIWRRLPSRLSARQFALGRLRLVYATCASEFVFSRAAYNRLGGFVSLPRGWCADDASWIRLAGRAGIQTLPGARVGWRLSGANISSNHGKDRGLKLQAQAQYLLWLAEHLARHPAGAGEPGDADVLRWARPWFFRQARTLGCAQASEVNDAWQRVQPLLDGMSIGASRTDALLLSASRWPARARSLCRVLHRRLGGLP